MMALWGSILTPPSPSHDRPQTPTNAEATEGKRRITCYLSTGLYEQARAAILELGAEGQEPASISALLGGALERELRRLAKKHRGGEPWTPHKGRLPGGRPRNG